LTALPPFLQPTAPSVFTLEITPRCQHQCAGCGNVFDRTWREMSADEWAIILARIRPYAQALRITGGEPTLHRQFARLLTRVDDLGVPFALFTNGNWPDPESVIHALKRCAHLQGILVSLHGLDADSYRRFTRLDDFDLVTRNIRRASEAGIRVATNTLLLTTTWDRLEPIAQLSLSLGASTVCFGRYYGLPIASLSLTAHQLESALRRIADLRRADPRIELANCVPACFLPDSDFGGRGCTSGFTHGTIGPRGDIRPCTHTPLTLGFAQRDNMIAVWNGSRITTWREQVPQACRACAALSRCRGGCRATAQQLHVPRDPLMRDPLTDNESLPVVELAISDRPRLACAVEAMPFGYALTCPGRYVTLSSLSRPLLDALDGQATVEDIHERFGDDGVQFVASLLYRHMVEV